MKYYVEANKPEQTYTWRLYLVLILLVLGVVALVARMLYLGIWNKDFLEKQGDARSIRIVNTPAHRGIIEDRNGVPLAVSIEVDSFWINPKQFTATEQQKTELSKLLKISLRSLKIKTRNHKRGFVYLKRRVAPETGAKVTALHIPGLYVKKEYKRFYPLGEVSAQLIGFTNVDDKGQEGLELAYNNYLSGKPGAKQVMKDRLGNIIQEIKNIQEPEPGGTLTLSIDKNIQYLAYRSLKETVQKFQADSAEALVLDVKTGEVLAMVNQPSYNPNARPSKRTPGFRNRAVTDLMEPGSTIKTFAVISALISHKYTPDTIVDTNPGYFYVKGNRIIDENINRGRITVTQVLQKSSNIGIAKITLSLPADNFLATLERFGFGQSTGSAFPGEVDGTLPDNLERRKFVLATLAFGYGMSASPLQLAHAYSAIASGGILKPVSLLKVDKPPRGQRIIPKKVAKQTLQMLETVLKLGGTGTRGRVPGYHIAGKTGTSYLVGPHGYEKHKYQALFIGVAPIKDPRLVVAVIVKNPKKQHMGGLVAAPTFAKIMEGTLRTLNIPPDDL